MKRILLLSTASLAMVMADFTLEGSKLTPIIETPPTVTEPAPPTDPIVTDPVPTDPIISEPTPPSAVGDIIPNSIDMIWADMNEPNTGWVSAMPSGFAQFRGAVRKDVADKGKFTDMNLWMEIEAGGDGSGCSLDKNRAVNTRVEFGWTRGYILTTDNKWIKYAESENHTLPTGNGSQYPFPKKDATGIFGSSRGCVGEIDDTIQQVLSTSYPTNGFKRIESNGFRSIKPTNYFRWHGWAKRSIVLDYTKIKAVFGQVYMRLIVEDPNKPDDRHLANYVAHLSSDVYDRDGNTQVVAYKGDIGISRYKKITNEWQPINFLSGSLTKAELEANPPPFTSVP